METNGDALLHSLIEKDRNHHVSFNGGLSNHMVMALTALWGLGADSKCLENFFNEYKKRLEPAIDTKVSVNEKNWECFRGQSGAYISVCSFFDRIFSRTTSIDLKLVFSSYVEPLLDGLTGAGFHPLIMLGYAVYPHLDTTLLASALAAFCVQWTPLTTNTELMPCGKLDLKSVLQKIHESTIDVDRNVEGLLVDRLQAMAKLKEYKQWVIQLRPPLNGTQAQSLLDGMSSLAIRQYALLPKSFLALHVFTGLFAVRSISPYLSEIGLIKAVCEYWKAFLAAYLYDGCVDLGEGPVCMYQPATENSMNKFEEIAKKTCASTDEHVIKVVYACREEYQRCGDDTLLEIAHRM